MKRLALAVVVLGSCLVFADTKLKHANVDVGPIVALNCAPDGGFLCTRDAGSVGNLKCNSASATEPGCVTPSDQTFAGKKSFSGRIRLNGAAHGSLTACSSGEKGTWQTCTTHNAPVFCDGTTNHELLGSSADEEVLAAIYVNGIPAPIFGGVSLPSTASWTINALSGQWIAGTGSGTLRLGILGSAGTCICDIDCDAPTARTTCTSTCTFSASDDLILLRGSSGTAACTLDPHVVGNLNIMGIAQ